MSLKYEPSSEPLHISATLNSQYQRQVSLTLLMVVTLSTPPTSPQVLDKFYRNTRPWGLWGPVTGKMRDPEGLRRVEVETTLDRVASGVAVVWQISLFLLAMVAATDLGGASTAPLTALVGVTSLLLYLVFYRPLRWWDAGAVPLLDLLMPWDADRSHPTPSTLNPDPYNIKHKPVGP